MRQAHKYVGGALTGIGVLVCTCVTGLSANAAAGHAKPTKLTKTPRAISEHGRSRLPHTVHALTASSDRTEVGAPWSVYEQFNRTPNVLSYGGNLQPDPTGDLVAVAANKKHTSHVFGVATDNMALFSSVGKVVTARSVTSRRIYWWVNPFNASPAAPQHSYTPPKNDKYQTSAPDGWIQSDALGRLFDVNAKTKNSRLIGWPFPGQEVSAVSGPTGIVVTGTHGIVFIRYGSKHVTMLDTSLIQQSTSDRSNTPLCTSVSNRYAACGNRAQLLNDDYDPAMSNLFLAPLDGSKAINVVHFHPNLSDDNPLVTGAVYKKSLAWNSIKTGKYDDIVVKNPNGKPMFGPPIARPPIATHGGFLATDSHEQKALVFDRNLRSHRLSSNARSSLEALDFSVSAGTIAWTEDDGAPNGAKLRVHRRAITASGKRRLLGPTTTIASDAQRTPIAASGKYTVYGAGVPKRSTVSGKLIVVSRGKTRTINGAHTKTTPMISGHRLLYAVSEKKFAVRDLRSGKTTSYPCRAAALDGSRLVIATPIPASVNQDVTIKEVDLTNGTTQVVEPDVQMYPGYRLFVHGSVVGWWDIGAPEQHYRQASHYRDLATSDPTVTLPLDQMIWSFTDAGILVEKLPHGGPNPDSFAESDDGFADAPAIDFLLRPYATTQ
jgi:hypothetical protein